MGTKRTFASLFRARDKRIDRAVRLPARVANRLARLGGYGARHGLASLGEQRRHAPQNVGPLEGRELRLRRQAAVLERVNGGADLGGGRVRKRAEREARVWIDHREGA